MHRISFFLAYPFIYLLASLPFSVLYKVSDFLCYILKLTRYRKAVVWKNLCNSFPEKSPSEINTIVDDYYKYLCDLMLETFKTLKMTEQEARERCVFHRAEWMEKLYDENRSIILLAGHYGNWEWGGPSFSLNTKHKLFVVYRPLSNPYFEKMMVGMRTKFGTRITPVNQTLRDMVASRKEITATAFIADQTAPRDKAHWMTFLHQDTAVFTGPERLAAKFNYPVVYLNIQRTSRGYYDMYFELMFAHPQETSEGEISDAFMKRLEKEIIKDPAVWLWSHRRWKHSRVASEVNP